MAGLRARTASQRHAEQSGPNMTPMVDVTLVILIFFMAAAGLAVPELLLNVQLAEPAEVEIETDAQGDGMAFELPSVELVLGLGVEDGAVVATGLGLSGVDLAALLSAIDERGPGLPSDASIVIEASDETPYEAVVAVRDRLASVGIERVGLR